MEITKEDILSSLKNDILDNLSDDCYEWIFEQDSEVQRVFNKRLTEEIKSTLLEDKNVKNTLIANIAEIFVDTYKDELLEIISDKIIGHISLVDITKNLTSKLIKRLER